MGLPCRVHHADEPMASACLKFLIFTPIASNTIANLIGYFIKAQWMDLIPVDL
jgi:hypothetical protein